MTGTSGQIDWAEQIKPRVNADFDRVARAFLAVAETQPPAERADTMAMVAILEDKRAEVMANPSASYFLCEWREITDQVRRLIAADARYQAILGNRAARKRSAPL